jgi:hypothetical protein
MHSSTSRKFFKNFNGNVKLISIPETNLVTPTALSETPNTTIEQRYLFSKKNEQLAIPKEIGSSCLYPSLLFLTREATIILVKVQEMPWFKNKTPDGVYWSDFFFAGGFEFKIPLFTGFRLIIKYVKQKTN